MTPWLTRYSRFKCLIKTRVLYARKFNSIGSRSIIISPMQFSDTQSVKIGNSVYISHYAWLMGDGNKKHVTLSIGNNVQVGHFAHIIAKFNVIIEDSVLIADKVYISDCDHNYMDISTPIYKQGIHRTGDVKIGEGSWLGENVCVLGAKIGKHCVIGANSVVVHDIPDYSIAVGAPAKVIRSINGNNV